MLSDPQSVTVNSVANSLPRVSVGPQSSVYQNADGSLVMTIKQTKSAQRSRHEVRLSAQKVAADPISAVNKQVSTSVYLVIDEPLFGFTDVELGYYVDALKGFLSSGNVDKVLGGES